MSETTSTGTSLTATTQHICSPECQDCFRRRVCRDGHDYTDAMPQTTTTPYGTSYIDNTLRLYCRRCGDIR